MALKPNFGGDADDYEIVREDLGFGIIREMTTREADIVAPWVDNNPNVVYVAGSGLPPGSYPSHFGPGGSPFAFEVIRFETNPAPGEPDLNVNRYVVGPDRTGQKFVGYDVTIQPPNPTNGQVADHWSDWGDIDQKFPTKKTP